MIRRMLETDYAGVRKLMQQVHHLHHVNRPDIFGEGEALRKPYFQKLLGEEYTNFVYVEDEKIVGLLVMRHESAQAYEVMKERNIFYISDLVVDENYRKRGIAHALYHQAIAVAKESHASRVELTVWSFNKDAIAFYESLGMQPMNLRMEMKI